MPAYVWITVAAAVAFVALVAFGRRWWHAVWYSWRHAAHVIEETAAEYGPGTFYGSAILDEELTWRNSSPMTAELNGVPDWLPAPPVDPAPWLEQTMAELSPEALEPLWEYRADHPADLPERVSLPEVVLPDAGGWISGPCLDDPGPGDAAVEPPASSGPDQAREEGAGGPVASQQGIAVDAAAGNASAQRQPEMAPAAALLPPPSEWLTGQLAVVRRWAEWHQQKAVILA